jgi:hypothetical protein
MEVGTRKKTYIWTKTGWVTVPVKVLYLVKWSLERLRCINEINGNDLGYATSLKTIFWTETRWE